MMEKIIRETTVWRQTVKLKENLVNEGIFNLRAVDNLYITNINKVLRGWLERNKASTRQLSLAINKNGDYLWTILNKNSSISLKTLLDIKDKLGIQLPNEEMFKLFVKNKCKFLIFNKGGVSVPINLPLYTNQINGFIKFLSPKGKTKVYIKKNTPLKIQKEIEKLFDVKIIKEGGYNLIIYSNTLNNFLKTFYFYTKQPKIKFPLTRIVAKLMNKIDLIKGIILPLAQSDGSIGKHKYGVYWRIENIFKNEILHNLFADAFYFVLHKYPSTYLKPMENNQFIRTAIFLSEEQNKKLIKFCRSVKKSPNKLQQISKDYLKESQPDLNYLKDTNLDTKTMALRLWFCAEGSISVNRAKKNNFIRPKLHLACANPTLVLQLYELCKDFGLKMNIEYTKNRDKSWSGIVGLYANRIEVIKNFIRIGGFLPKVYVSKSSKYYQGLEKQKVLLAILKYRKLEKEGVFSKSLPITKVHRKIREIAIKNI